MEAKKVVLIILTILILGPIVFVGSCFPIGAISFNNCFESSCSWFYQMLIPAAFIIGIALAIFVCYKVIKKIIKSNSQADVNNTN